MDVLDDGLMVKFTPHNEMKDKCVEYGKVFGLRLLEKTNITTP
jgi:hypothetical protein